MATAAIQYGFSPSQSGATFGVAKRQSCEIQRSQLELQRSSFIALWQDLNDFILPNRGRFQWTDVNRGNRRNLKIIDSTATLAVRTLSSGMMSGITNPAMPWFQLGTPDADVGEQDDVKEWLHEVQERIGQVLLRSNFYDQLPLMYADLGTFGTSAWALLEDPQDVIRCYDYPVGSYSVGNDDRLNVRTFVRVFQLTVQQVVQRWGEINEATGLPNFLRGDPTTISLSVQALWQNGSRQAWVTIVHFIQPNYSYDGTKIESKYKRFEELYYELGVWGGTQTTPEMIGVLAHNGYDEFPVMVGRWEKAGEDVYGTNCPGIVSLGDVKMLQAVAKKLPKAIDLMLDPSLIGPASLKASPVSLLPGGITYGDSQASGKDGLRPIREVNFATAIEPTNQMQDATRARIDESFFKNLILLLSSGDQRDRTATEVNELHEEKLLGFGPVLSRLNVDVFNPAITRVFNIMMRRGMFPPAPQALQGQALQIEYVSIMAQAQKQVAIAGLERFAGFVGQYAQIDPSILDVVDGDELVRQHADADGIAPKILRSEEQVQSSRAQKAQQAQQQQAAETMPKVADAVHRLSQSPTGGDTALSALVQKVHAKSALQATASPPASVLPQ